MIFSLYLFLLLLPPLMIFVRLVLSQLILSLRLVVHLSYLIGMRLNSNLYSTLHMLRSILSMITLIHNYLTLIALITFLTQYLRLISFINTMLYLIMMLSLTLIQMLHLLRFIIMWMMIRSLYLKSELDLLGENHLISLMNFSIQNNYNQLNVGSFFDVELLLIVIQKKNTMGILRYMIRRAMFIHLHLTYV